MKITSRLLALWLPVFAILTSQSWGSTNVTLWAYNTNSIVDVAPGCVGKIVSFNATFQNNLSA